MKRRINSGFTLVELLITLLIMSIVLAIATPSLADFQRQYRTDSAMRELQQLLAFARNQAISYRLRVTVCFLQEGQCSNGSWDSGVTVFTDINGNYRLDEEDKILFKSSVFHAQDGLFYNRTAIRFLPDGLASGTNGTLSYCPERLSSNAKGMIVNQSGRTRFSNDNLQCQG